MSRLRSSRLNFSFKENYVYNVVSWENHWENLNELQVKNNESSDGPGRIGNPNGPYVRYSLGQ
jgi:hypothetical protein